MEQHPQKLQESLPVSTANDISIYKGGLTTSCIVESVSAIKKTFPNLPVGFYDILTDRINANGFCDQRLKDAVAHVIDTCIYPTPTIAQFISFDKRVKTYTYHQITKMIEDGDNMDNYQSFQFKDRPVRVWIHKNDVAMYKISA